MPKTVPKEKSLKSDDANLQSAKCDKGEGNTDSSPSIHACKRYCFTYNNYDKNILDKFNTVLSVLGKWIYGFEVAPTTGTPHLQGYINLNKKERITGLKKHELLKPLKFIECKGSEEANIKYCIKEGNYKSNFYKEKRQLKIIDKLRPWQQSIIDLISDEPDERTINWIYDPIGNNGKTVFCKYLIVKHNAIIATAGDAKDIANLLTNQIEGGRDLNENTTFIFNIARDGFVSYKALEGVKDGLMTNIKYEAKQLVFNNPHVWIFSNDKPDTSKLSSDRWRIFTIKENMLVPYIDDSEETPL